MKAERKLTTCHLQTALERLATVERERQDAIDQLQASRRRSGAHATSSLQALHATSMLHQAQLTGSITSYHRI